MTDLTGVGYMCAGHRGAGTTGTGHRVAGHRRRPQGLCPNTPATRSSAILCPADEESREYVCGQHPSVIAGNVRGRIKVEGNGSGRMVQKHSGLSSPSTNESGSWKKDSQRRVQSMAAWEIGRAHV